MAITIEQVSYAFNLFYRNIHRQDFVKSLKLSAHGERDMLPLLRAFLLGFFGESLAPEADANLAGTAPDKGNFDFVIETAAIAFAVRKKSKDKTKSALSYVAPPSDLANLLKHDGLQVLVLFDFTKHPLSADDIETIATWDIPGRGNDTTAVLHVLYFCLESTRPIQPAKEPIHKRIHVT